MKCFSSPNLTTPETWDAKSTLCCQSPVLWMLNHPSRLKQYKNVTLPALEQKVGSECNTGSNYISSSIFASANLLYLNWKVPRDNWNKKWWIVNLICGESSHVCLFLAKSQVKKNTFCGLPRLLYAPSTPTLRLLSECSEISIVVCVFGGKQHRRPALCEKKDKETKSNRLFLCKENSNTEKGGGWEGGIAVCGWLQIKKGVQSEVLLVWVSKISDRHRSLAGSCEKTGWAAPADIKTHQRTKRKHICC